MKYKIHLSLTKEEINRLKTMTKYYKKTNKKISMSKIVGEYINKMYRSFLIKTHYTPEG